MLYAMLNRDAQRWWYNRELRDNGKRAEARQREREAIRSHVRTLRACQVNGGYFTVGRGGWSIHYASGCNLSGGGGADQPMIQAAIRLGIPGYDSTTVATRNIVQAIGFPLVAFSADDAEQPPYGSFSRAPFAHVVERYRAIGATLYNIP